MTNNDISKKHWIAFFVIGLINIASVTIVTGIGVPILNALLCLVIIRFFLKESISEYGLHFRKMHMQLFCGIILAFIVLFLLYSRTRSSWAILLQYIKNFPQHFSSYSSFALYLIFRLIYVIPEELVFRGFLITFFQRLFKCPFASIFLSAVLFALFHYPLHPYLSLIIFTFVIGIIYGYLRLKDPQNFTLFSLCLAHFLHNIGVDLLDGNIY